MTEICFILLLIIAVLCEHCLNYVARILRICVTASAEESHCRSLVGQQAILLQCYRTTTRVKLVRLVKF